MPKNPEVTADEEEELLESLTRLHLRAISSLRGPPRPAASAKASAPAAPSSSAASSSGAAAAAQAPSTSPRSDSEASSVPAGQAAPLSGPAAAEPEVIRGPPPVLEPQGHTPGYYAIYKCKKQPGLVGVHYTLWETLEARLPGGKLAGSGAISCKKFEQRNDAVKYFTENAGGQVPKVYKY